MIEYRIHGRGGQGSVAAAYLLASAAFEAGYMCQAFPSFGAERRGAPVAAFVRIDSNPIHIRSQVRRPDFLIVQDDTLLLDRGITDGLKPGGAMIVNTLRSDAEVSEAFDCTTWCIPATDLAMQHIGRPIPNTALLAALLTLTGDLPVEALAAALKGRFKGKVLENNLALIDQVKGLVPAGAWKESEHA